MIIISAYNKHQGVGVFWNTGLLL